MKRLVGILVIVIFGNSFLFAQSELEFCPMGNTESQEKQFMSITTQTSFLRDGKYLTAQGELKILLVFVRFPGDSENISNWWLANQSPAILNSIIDANSNVGSTNQYNLTHYFDVMSLGDYSVVGDAISVVAPDTPSGYGYDLSVASEDVLDYISTNDLVDFSDYDNWEATDIGEFSNTSDDLVDMVVMIWKGENFLNGDNWTGCAALMRNDCSDSTETDPGILNVNNGKKVKFGYGLNAGSGVTAFAYSSVKTLFNTVAHEIGHWILGENHPYGDGVSNRVSSIMSANITSSMSVNASERDRLGWGDPISEITENMIDEPLGDFLTTGNAFKYISRKNPITSTHSYYYIENHQKLSIYDDATQDATDKGIFILRAYDAFNNDAMLYMVSDGFWDWENASPYHVDSPWDTDPSNGTDQLAVFKKTNPKPTSSIAGSFMKSKLASNYDSEVYWLYAYLDEDNNLDVDGYFTGLASSEMKASYNSNYGTIFGPHTNPAPKDKNYTTNTVEDFGMLVKSETLGVVTVDFYYDYDPYLIELNTTWDGQIFLSEDVTLSDGADLTILPGTTIYFDPGVEIIVDHSSSKIIAEGTSSNPIVFTSSESSPAAGDWDGIEMQGTGNVFEHVLIEYATTGLYFRNNNNTVEYSTIRNNSSYGIRTAGLNASTYAELIVSNSYIHNNGSHGVYLGAKSRGGITYSDIKNNTGNGIYVYQATLGKADQSGSDYFSKNEVSGNFGYGVRVGSGGKVYDGYTAHWGNNVISAGNNDAIRLDNSTSARWDDMGGSHTVINAVPGKRYVTNLAQTVSGETTVNWTIPVQSNAWNVNNNPTTQSDKFYGPVDYLPYTSGATSEAVTGGPVGPQGSVPSLINPYAPDSQPVEILTSALVQQKVGGISNKESRDEYLYVSSEIQHLKQEIQNQPQSDLIPMRLNGLLSYYNSLPEDKKPEFGNIYEWLDPFIDQDHLARRPSINGLPFAMRSQAVLMLKTHQKVQDGRYEEALSDIQLYEHTITNLDIKRELGFVKIQALDNLERYTEILNELDELTELSKLGLDPSHTYSDYQTLKDTYAELLEEQGGSTAGEDSFGDHKEKEVELQTPSEFILNPAYPNPFNPVTILSFDMPLTGKVKVEVFDISGRQVAVLANSTYQAGTHNIRFDASGLASGVYIIRALSGSNVSTQKVTLIK